MGPQLHDQYRQDTGRPQPRQPPWAGLANTYFWMIRRATSAGVILMQVLPSRIQNVLGAFAAFESGVYAGLDAGARGGVSTKNPSRVVPAKAGTHNHRRL